MEHGPKNFAEGERGIARRKVIEMTRVGDVVEWPRRLASLAERMGLPMEEISLFESPAGISDSIVSLAESRGLVEKLKEVVDTN